MARRKPTDTPARIYTNRVPGCICKGCNCVIPLGAQKTWSRSRGAKANYDMVCAERLGVLVYRDGKWYRPDGHEAPVFGDEPVRIHGYRVNGNGNGNAPVPAPVEDLDEENDVEDVVEVVPVPAPKPPAPVIPDWLQGMAQAILPYVQEMIQSKVDENEVRAMIEKYGVKREILEVHDARDGAVRVIEGKQHPMFRKALDQCEMRMHSMLVGPCASGKTTSVMTLAKALGYKLYFQTPVSSKYELLGFNDANGKYVPTAFYHWFTSTVPALLLWDEYDACDPNALLDVNAALENRVCTFPNSPEPIEIGNRDSVAIACANTYGLGATDDYVGRNRLDAACLNRFAVLTWDYDESLERMIAGNDAWVERVQKLRRNARTKGLRVIISPRSSYRGAKKLAKGWTMAEVEQTEIKYLMTETDWRAIQ